MLRLLSMPSTLGANALCKETEGAIGTLDFEKVKATTVRPGFKEEIAAYTEAGLKYQIHLVQWRAKCQLARDMGFKEFTVRDAVTLLTGKKCRTLQPGLFDYNGSVSDEDRRESREYCQKKYNTWRDLSMRLPRISSGRHALMFGPLNELRIAIPPGFIMRMLECQKLETTGPVLRSSPYSQDRLFNSFCVLAPMWCWSSPKPQDPALFAVISGPWNKAINEWDHRFYFLGRWD